MKLLEFYENYFEIQYPLKKLGKNQTVPLFLLPLLLRFISQMGFRKTPSRVIVKENQGTLFMFEKLFVFVKII